MTISTNYSKKATAQQQHEWQRYLLRKFTILHDHPS